MAVFQMPLDAINNIMTSNQNWTDTGLGESGETYVVGNDFLLKTESRFLLEDPTGYLDLMASLGMDPDVRAEIQASGSAIGRQIVKTRATERAISGEMGSEIVQDYRDISVLSAFKPLDIKDVTWAIMSEMDEEEAFLPVIQLTNFVIVSAVIDSFLSAL